MKSYLYKFAKCVNSTARPSGGSYFDITLKGNCSIVNPVIVIKNISNPTGYNYLYIPDFGRYYWVDNWTWDLGVWSASCTVDALATYRNEIGNSTEYIVRASARQDGTIIDTLYPVKCNPTAEKTNFDTGFLKPTATSSGIYVLGIISKHANSFGGVTYYAMSAGNMRKLIAQLLSNVDYTGVDETEISNALEKVLFDPTEYIKSSVYIPYTPTNLLASSPRVSSVDVGWWSFSISAWIIGGSSGSMADTKTTTISLPIHPQAAERGIYTNAAPYTTRELYYPPFGVITLGAGLSSNASAITIETTVEMTTGDAVCRVTANNGAVLAECSAKVGVSVQISRIALNPELSVGGALKTGAAAIAGGLTKFFQGGTAGDVVNGIADGAQTVNATVTGTGVSGSVLSYYMDAYLITTFYSIVSDDNEHRGRPLCRKLKISDVAGYLMIADPDIKLTATSAEIDAVRQYMTTGFYFE